MVMGLRAALPEPEVEYRIHLVTPRAPGQYRHMLLPPSQPRKPEGGPRKGGRVESHGAAAGAGCDGPRPGPGPVNRLCWLEGRAVPHTPLIFNDAATVNM